MFGPDRVTKGEFGVKPSNICHGAGTFFREVRSGRSKELLYDDDLVLVSETPDSLRGKLEA